jgi:hypothetical protein
MDMKKGICCFFGFVFIFAFLVIMFTGSAKAEVNVNINIGPPVLVSEPSEVVYVPRMGFYYVPGISYDVFFYNGYWWSPRGDRWYRAGQYNGSWVIVQRNYVPGLLFKVPKNYRSVYKNERPINYGQFKKQYRGNEGGQPKNMGGQLRNMGEQSRNIGGKPKNMGGQQKNMGGKNQGRGGKH